MPDAGSRDAITAWHTLVRENEAPGHHVERAAGAHRVPHDRLQGRDTAGGHEIDCGGLEAIRLDAAFSVGDDHFRNAAVAWRRSTVTC